jgi:hypothetical protein
MVYGEGSLALQSSRCHSSGGSTERCQLLAAAVTINVKQVEAERQRGASIVTSPPRLRANRGMIGLIDRKFRIPRNILTPDIGGVSVQSHGYCDLSAAGRLVRETT